MAAGTYDIVIDQGSDFSTQVVVEQNDSAVVLSNHSVRGQLRPTPTSSSLTATFTCNITDASNGTFKFELSNSTTAAIDAGKYYYDIELVNTSTSVVTRLLQGVARVTPEVTR